MRGVRRPGICTHGNRKASCKECGGSSICTHGKQKASCSDCLTMAQKLGNGQWCVACVDKRLSAERRRAGVQLCATCDPAYPQRIELIVRPLLLAVVDFPPSAADNDMLGSRAAASTCDASVRRPDLAWYGDNLAIFVEIDENGGHPDRVAACEMGKMWCQTVAVKKLMGEATRVFYLRFNPDRYDGGRVRLEQRVKAVGKAVNALIAGDHSALDSAAPHVAYFYYHSACRFHIDAVAAQPDSFHMLRLGTELES